MSRVINLVERALRDYPDTRDNDRNLVVKVWELQYGKPMHSAFKEFILFDAIFPDTITRARRKFQEHGKYKPSAETQRKREQRFRAIRESTPRTTDPEQMGLI